MYPASASAGRMWRVGSRRRWLWNQSAPVTVASSTTSMLRQDWGWITSALNGPSTVSARASLFPAGRRSSVDGERR